MKVFEKYAAARRALALMQRGGDKGRKFFDDLMSRQTNDTIGAKFRGDSMRANKNQAHLLDGLLPANPGSGRQEAIQLLRDLLKRTKGKPQNPGDNGIFGIDRYDASMRNMPIRPSSIGRPPPDFDINEMLKRVR